MFDNARYFNVSRAWKKLKPIYDSKEIQDVIDFEWEMFLRVKEYDVGHQFGRSHDKKTRLYGPWLNRKGRKPGYWYYMGEHFCHWSSNINIEVFKIAFPNEDWRIVTNDFHSFLFSPSKKVILDYYGLYFKYSVNKMIQTYHFDDWFEELKPFEKHDHYIERIKIEEPKPIERKEKVIFWNEINKKPIIINI